MQRLLATTAAVVPLASCTRSDTQTTQTVTIPASTASATHMDDAAQGSLLPPLATTAATTVAKPPDDMQYMVVDPMPTPAKCIGLATATHASATFKRDPGGLILEVMVSLPTGAGWAGTTFASGTQPSPWSGQLVSSNVGPTMASARIRPTAGVSSLGVTFSIMCAAGPGSLSITASFPSTPVDGTKAILQKSDY
jgi:hypothetical protein